jgi:hypothetical protein
MTEAKATPQFDEATNTISFPDVEHVVYKVGGQPVKDDLKIEKKTRVSVSAEQGFVLAKNVVREHVFTPVEKEEKVADLPPNPVVRDNRDDRTVVNPPRV